MVRHTEVLNQLVSSTQKYAANSPLTDINFLFSVPFEVKFIS